MTTARANRSAAYWSNLIALCAVIFSLSTTVLGAIITVSVSVYKLDAVVMRLNDVDVNGTQHERETRFRVDQNTKEIAEIRATNREIVGETKAVRAETAEVRSKVDVLDTKIDLLLEQQRRAAGTPATPGKDKAT